MLSMDYSIIGKMRRRQGVPDGPKTFDDVMKIAKNSAKFNGDVQEYGGLEFYNGDNFAALFLSWIMQNGGDFWNEDQTKFVLTSPEAKEAWQKLVDLVTVEKVTDTKHITAKCRQSSISLQTKRLN